MLDIPTVLSYFMFRQSREVVVFHLGSLGHPEIWNLYSASQHGAVREDQWSHIFSNCLWEVNFSHTFCRDRPCWGKAIHVIDKLINGATRLLSLRLPVLRSQHEVPKFYNDHCLEFSWTLPRYFLLLSRLKKQWAAWSIWIGNPAIATGLLLHEVIVWCIWVSYMSENGSYNLQRHIHRRSSGSTLK